MKTDLEKRRRVMERSMRLGHCICDPHRPCPCDVFRNQQICPCAGERPESDDLSQIKLTELVHNAGCASKLSPADLERVLKRLPEVKDPAVISGLASADDAAIYRIAEDLCLVQTVDVFTPCVDDPHLFGRICAANCLSDVYAMGGTPRTALSILAFPSETLDGEIMYRMLAGAMETLAEAGVALIGGHSIKDQEIKLGFSITGTIDPKLAASLETATAGDMLVLTKPLGTGVLAFARQIGQANPAGIAAAEKAMSTLNRGAAEAMLEAGASACTDITGFGLFGHLLRLARQSRLSVRLQAEALPAFEGVLDAFRNDIIPGSIERNREFVQDALRIEDGLDEAWVHLGCDAQTSGGLLIAVSPERLPRLRAALESRNVSAHVIGRLEPLSDNASTITLSRSAPSPDQPATPMSPHPESTEHAPGCCAEAFATAGAAGNAAETQRAFGAFMRSVQAPGALSEKAKELILISLILQSRCRPCFASHYDRARALGVTQAELDEAAWCAIALGGAPVKMFYQECMRDLAK
jgi:selenide,water dikinase